MGAQDKLIEHALTLITRAELEAPESSLKIRRELEQWRGRSLEHASAYDEAMSRWQLLGGMAADLRNRFTEPATKRQNTTLAGRRSVLSMGILAAATALFGGASWYWQQPVFTQAYQTGTAEQIKVALPDSSMDGLEGSRIDLNARSTVWVQLYRHRRVARLEEGAARFEVMADASRPFSVSTRAGTVEVIGTVFTVSDWGGTVSVAVERGHVQFRPLVPDGGGTDARPLPSVIDLRGGEILTIRDGRAEPVRSIDPAVAAAWREGWLVFDNARLDEVIPAINAFRLKPIFLADKQAAVFRLTGRFRAAESDEFLQVLPTILAVTTQVRDDGSPLISAR